MVGEFLFTETLHSTQFQIKSDTAIGTFFLRKTWAFDNI